MPDLDAGARLNLLQLFFQSITRCALVYGLALARHLGELPIHAVGTWIAVLHTANVSVAGVSKDTCFLIVYQCRRHRKLESSVVKFISRIAQSFRMSINRFFYRPSLDDYP